MILEKQKESHVLQEGESQDSIGMSLDLDSAQILMQMLSKNLYSDSIGSTIREWSSNALDSHRRTGIDKPIIVSFDRNSGDNYEFSVEDFGIGFYTKYGDGGVDISPIADLYKSEVRELGRYLGIPQEIINATPTDGLWDDDRNDEQQIGATYEELEWAMEHGMEKISYTEKEYNVSKIFETFNQKNNHKMVPIPIFNLKENKII